MAGSVRLDWVHNRKFNKEYESGADLKKYLFLGPAVNGQYWRPVNLFQAVFWTMKVPGKLAMGLHRPLALLSRRTGNIKCGHAAVRHQSNGNLAAEL